MQDHNTPIPEPPEEYLLPHDLEAEQAVLGAIILDSVAMETAEDMLQGEEFYALRHQQVFIAALELTDNNDPVDLITLTSRLASKGELEGIGGLDYLSAVANSVPTAANVAHYIGTVKKHYVHRQTILELQRLQVDAKTTDEPEKLIARIQSKIDALADQTAATKQEFRNIGDVATEFYEKMEKSYFMKAEGGITGVPSGFPDLDRMTAGFQKGDLIIVAARPSVGKTALALNISQNVAVRANEPVAIFSLEMGASQLFQRMVAAEGNIDAGRMRTGHLQNEDWEKIAMSMGTLSTAPIHIDDSASITVADIRSKCRRLKKEKGLGMILIDYLQLIQGRGKSGENRQQEVSTISRTLKQIARELDVPVVALSQLSRAVEQRQDKRPMMSDLRESGSIEQDADIVAFLYREDRKSVV